MQAGRFDEAAGIYRDLVTERPSDGGLLMNLGMARYMAGDAAGALEPLQKALKLSPALSSASLFLGSALLDLGRVDEAIAPLRRAVSALPDNVDAREMLARACLALSKFSDAVTHYRALAGLQPQSPRAWYGLARSYEGMAEHALERLQTAAPDSPLLELLVADVAVTQDKFAAALAIYRRVMTGTPPVGGLHEAVAELYSRAGHDDWAAAERAKASRQPAACTAKLAECHFLAGRYRESLRAALASSTPVAHYWAIRAANHLATEAVEHLETLPESVELHLIRAEIAQSRGQNPEAVREVRAAVALEPGNAALESALAEALLHARDLEEAIPLLERLNRDTPGDPSLLLMLGDALLEQQQVDRAIPVLEQAANAPHALPHARASLGRAYLQAGRYAEAVRHLEAAASDDPDGETHLHLARAYQALQRADDARRAMAEYQARKRQEATPPPDNAPEPVLTPPE
jgi:predicted Zn-dependent protease